MTAPARLAAPRVVLELDVEVPTADGELLLTDVYRPAGGSAPVILLRTPYGIRKMPMIQVARALATRGFAVVLQNVRGRFGSGGEFEPFVHEVEDARTCLSWLAGRSWCDGRVIPFGCSYGSYAAFASAIAAEPVGLQVPGIVSIAGMLEPYSYFYRGDAFVLHWALPWAWIVHGTHGAPVQAERLVELARRPLGDVLRGSRIRAPHWERWLESSHREAPYWGRVGLAKAMEGRPIEVLHVGGWKDFGLEASFETYGDLGGSGGCSRQYLVVGPWEHNQIFGSLVSELMMEGRDNGDQPAPGAVLFQCLRHWTVSEGPDRPIPRVLLWRSESEGAGGRWIGGDHWPEYGRSELYLSRHPGGSGELSQQVRGPGCLPRWRHDPDRPVPTGEGRCWSLDGWCPAPGASRAEFDERSDLVRFQGPEAQEPFTLSGRPSVELWASEPDAGSGRLDYYVRLVEVDPGGTSTYLTDGIQRSSGPSRTPRRVVVRLGPLFRRIGIGHRLELQVAASSFPQFDCVGEPGERVLWHGPATPSKLVVPTALSRLGWSCPAERDP